jgi:hypothetical protein
MTLTTPKREKFNPSLLFLRPSPFHSSVPGPHFHSDPELHHACVPIVHLKGLCYSSCCSSHCRWLLTMISFQILANNWIHKWQEKYSLPYTLNVKLNIIFNLKFSYFHLACPRFNVSSTK